MPLLILLLMGMAAGVSYPALGDEAAMLRTEKVAQPIRSARAWMSAVAPNARGGFNFITQLWEYPSADPTEYVVLDLQTGQARIFEGPKGQGYTYANGHYQTGNQVRAPNGRIFFGEYGNRLSYYEPADETVKSLGKVLDDANRDRFPYQMVFGPEGKLYLGTQSDRLPTIVQIDPETLQWKTLGRVGKNRRGYSYAYRVAVDPPWIYVGVGQDPWELAALNAETGESKVLLEAEGLGFVKFDPRPEGILAKVSHHRDTPKARTERWWCADGQLFPFTDEKDPAKLPFKPRATAPVASPVKDAPQFDLSQLNATSDGRCLLLWQPAGATNAWREATFQIHFTHPIGIESLAALPDGSVLGNARQYHGFFRWHPAEKRLETFPPGGPSGGPRLLHQGLLYICGYPSSVLSAYDPTKPWTLPRQANASKTDGPSFNPTPLGYFRPFTDTHYPYFLVPSANGRLVLLGRRERTGSGLGIGWYDPAAKKYGGHHENMEHLMPRGLVVLDGADRVVASASTKEKEGLLLVFDRELKEIERLDLKPEVLVPGDLRPDPAAGPAPVFLGFSPSAPCVYRYDLAQKKILGKLPLPVEPRAVCPHPKDGSFWFVCGRALMRFDPAAFRISTIGTLPLEVGKLAWAGNDLWLAGGEGGGYHGVTELHRVLLPSSTP
ncbi:MAG: hypothetical protein HUU04_01910 [Verrucomicrobiae bacterium]|nr:hypothetical protein [Verrucomicrobiae bacterium]